MQKSKQTVNAARPELTVNPKEAMQDALRRLFGCGLEDNVQFLILRALVHMTVLIDDLHNVCSFDR